MYLKYEEIVELIHREMYVRNGVMLGSKAAAKLILEVEEAAKQRLKSDYQICGHHKDAIVGNGVTQWCVACEANSR